MQDTLEFWEKLDVDKYEVMISDITIEELSQCPQPKKTVLFDYLEKLNFIDLAESEESLALANDYIKLGVLSSESKDDCRYIALATIAECELIVSWNFKHFVNFKTINKVQAVNKLLGYRENMRQ